MNQYVFWGCVHCGRVLSGVDGFEPQEARAHRCRRMPDGTPDGMSKLVPHRKDRAAEPKHQQPETAGGKK